MKNVLKYLQTHLLKKWFFLVYWLWLFRVAIGFIGGAEMLGGTLAGVTTCGVLMAIFQSNAGGAWDNAKKMIEEARKKRNRGT